MKSDRWQQIERICQEALQREQSQRAAFLEEACAGDETLHSEVEHLLAQETKAHDFLETPAPELVARTMMKEQADYWVGRVVGSYRILSLLGTGGMGEVYLAQDTTLDRKVTLKFLPDFMREDPTARRRFVREAKLAAALDHPFICKIYETGEAEQGPYIAMEYLEGTTLKERLSQGAFSVKGAVQTALEITEALEAAHRHDIVHRDLKPANIMLTGEGHVKIMDFGLAKRVAMEGQDQEITAVLTETGSTLGTVPYMSPEQVRGQQVDTRSDIFSFGVVLYEMLTGVHPFQKKTLADTANAILSHNPAPLNRYTEDIPELLQHTVRKMLAKAVDRRFQSIHDVRIDLEEVLNTQTRETVSETERCDEFPSRICRPSEEVDLGRGPGGADPRTWQLPFLAWSHRIGGGHHGAARLSGSSLGPQDDRSASVRESGGTGERVLRRRHDR